MNSKTISTVISVSSILAWLVGIIVLFSNAVMGILLIILAIVLTYMSSVWKRELRHQEVLDAINDDQ